MIYSTFSSHVNLFDFETLVTQSTQLNFQVPNSRIEYQNYYAIFSLRFTEDCNTILACSNRRELLLFDLATNRVQTQILNAHQNDINSICLVNNCNDNIFYSAGDDCKIKVWDRRILANKDSAVGMFVGH